MKLTKLIRYYFLFSFFILSCRKESIEKPIISDVEIGVNNSNTVYIGAEFHVEANVVADGVIDKIIVSVHPESASGNWTEEWVFTEFSGLKNTNFHEHFDVPSNAVAGEYHFHLEVIDQEGQSTEIERDIQVQILVDNVMPVITITYPTHTNIQSFTNGQTISISGTVTDNIGIAGLYVGLVNVSQGLTDAQVTHENTITLLHTHDFTEPDNVSFNASIVMGAALDNDSPAKNVTWTPGDYYLLVKAPNLGGGVSYSAHYPISIN